MSRKKRMFDIDVPEDTITEGRGAAAAPATARRGPMASAIAENAEALQERKTAAQAIREENDALAHEFVALKEAGHVIELVPLDDVRSELLVRDRMPDADEELGELVTSIKELGLSNPIRVLPRPDGTYELVQGYRRLSAYRRLLDQTSKDQWARIPALIMPGQGDDLGGLYRRMVDENVIRKDLSFAEMAHAAQVYAADPATEAKDLGDAVSALFKSAAYSKRSYIKLFAVLLDELKETLHFPTEIPRALGITLARALKDKAGLADRVRADLEALSNPTADDELGVLKRYAGGGEQAAKTKPKRGVADPTKTKTTFHMATSAGRAKCTAGVGRLEISIDRDFSAIERKRLEAAIAALVDGIG